MIVVNVVLLANQDVQIDLGEKKVRNHIWKNCLQHIYACDMENIIIAAHIEKLWEENGNQNSTILVEMIHLEAIFYLQPQHEISKKFFPKQSLRQPRWSSSLHTSIIEWGSGLQRYAWLSFVSFPCCLNSYYKI